VRGRAIGIATVFNWLFNLLVRYAALVHLALVHLALVLRLIATSPPTVCVNWLCNLLLVLSAAFEPLVARTSPAFTFGISFGWCVAWPAASDVVAAAAGVFVFVCVCAWFGAQPNITNTDTHTHNTHTHTHTPWHAQRVARAIYRAIMTRAQDTLNGNAGATQPVAIMHSSM
jgi:hypothetical protein